MKNAMCCFGGPKSSAKVVDGKLILSFPGAVKPTVWQMDFGHIKASALEVDEKDGQFVLALKTPKGESVDVAPFAKKEHAVQGLIAAAKALENAEGKIRPSGESAESGYAAANDTRGGKKRGWLALLLGILFIFALLVTWVSLVPVPTGMPDSAAVTGAPAASGVPMSADDFLRAQ